MNQQLMQEIVTQLLLVEPDTIWGVTIKNFVDNFNEKQPEDVHRLIKEIQQSIADNEPVMQNILGKTYNYFNNLKL